MAEDWPSKSEIYGNFETLSDRLDDLDLRVQAGGGGIFDRDEIAVLDMDAVARGSFNIMLLGDTPGDASIASGADEPTLPSWFDAETTVNPQGFQFTLLEAGVYVMHVAGTCSTGVIDQNLININFEFIDTTSGDEFNVNVLSRGSGAGSNSQFNETIVLNASDAGWPATHPGLHTNRSAARIPTNTPFQIVADPNEVISATAPTNLSIELTLSFFRIA